MSGELKTGLVSLLRRSGLAAPLRQRLGGSGVILCLHEIQADPASELMTGSPPAFLAALIDEMRREGWDFVSLDEAVARLASQAATRPFAVVTFDDGYRDTLTRAMPVLEQRDVPFTVYVPTGALTRELYGWWLALRTLFVSRDEVDIACMDRRFSCADMPGKIAALNAATGWVHHDYRRKFDLAPTFRAYGLSLEALMDAYFVDQEQFDALARHRLATIGAHTTSHAALATLTPDQARAEMTENKRFLEQRLARDVKHFAYPYGDPRACGPRDAAIAREIGFASAVTTQTSPVFPAQRDDLHALPRVGVRPNETLGTLYYRISGLSWALNAHKRRRAAHA